MSYYSIDAILTDAQKIPCTFSLPVPGLGFLDDNPGGDISPTRPLPLPLYLALLLCVQRLSSSFTNNTQETPLLTIDLPPSLSPRVLNALRADPRTVDLRGLERGWYEGAGRVLEVLEDEEGDVGGVVGETFKIRAKEIADYALNARAGATGGGGGEGDFLRGLEEWERGLFRAVHDSSRATRLWMGEVQQRGKK